MKGKKLNVVVLVKFIIKDQKMLSTASLKTHKEMLKKDEGFRLKPYKDTKGYWTGGYGQKLKAVDLRLYEGFTEHDWDVIFNEKVECINLNLDQLNENYLTMEKLSQIRQIVISNMIYNMGFEGVNGFDDMWTALKIDQPKIAASEMLDSDWYMEVGDRALRLSKIMAFDVIKGY